jgi:tRNA(fMet)-specific endonuclease VapC
MRCLWDTDTVSEYLKGKNPHLIQRAVAFLNQYGQAPISLITRYEILRGLRARKATTKVLAFERFCQNNIILPLSEDVIQKAADVWASLKQAGTLIGDNDIFIAATALHHGLALATGNVAHFSRISGLILEDWTKP